MLIDIGCVGTVGGDGFTLEFSRPSVARTE